jgi:6-phosphogluconolactonase
MGSAAMPESGQREVRRFADLEELSRAAAERFVELAVQGARAQGRFAAALSGGSTPRRLFQILASPDYSPRVPWPQVHLFQVDERPVPPDHAESNYRMIRESLLDRVPLPAATFHRMVAESPDLDRAAREYADEVARLLKPAPGEFPRFDLIQLGMGPDGHTASLFPGSAALAEEKLWVRPNYVEKFGISRLTLTFPVINAAAEVIFLIAGQDKAAVLKQVLEGGARDTPYPARRIRPAAGKLSWYVDAAAASLL